MSGLQGICEVHGMLVKREGEVGVLMVVRERVSGVITLDPCGYERDLTPDQARYLARKLYRLARRIDARGE